jgi:predicted lipoprotein with Yx(FWY)xxD motif
MVFLSNIFVTATALASTLPLALGAALPQAKSSSPVSRRQDTWSEYDGTTQVFTEQGLCRYYFDPTSQDGLATCRDYCPADSPSLTCNGNANNDPSTTFTNPDGERWTPGECWCSNPALEALVDFSVVGLAEVGKVTCGVWLEAGKLMVDYGSYLIPGGAGAAANAAKQIVKSVSLAGKIGGKDRWRNFVKDTCQLDEWDFSLTDEVFELAKGAPAEAAE